MVNIKFGFVCGFLVIVFNKVIIYLFFEGFFKILFRGFSDKFFYWVLREGFLLLEVKKSF